MLEISINNFSVIRLVEINESIFLDTQPKACTI